MDRLTKPKAFLEKLTLTDADYQDSGMIDHIADLLERYHTEQLRLGGVSQQRELLIRFLKYYNQDDLTVSDEIDIDLFLNDNKPT